MLGGEQEERVDRITETASLAAVVDSSDQVAVAGPVRGQQIAADHRRLGFVAVTAVADFHADQLPISCAISWPAKQVQAAISSSPNSIGKPSQSQQ